jgi:hypothetical protein
MLWTYIVLCFQVSTGEPETDSRGSRCPRYIKIGITLSPEEGSLKSRTRTPKKKKASKAQFSVISWFVKPLHLRINTT